MASKRKEKEGGVGKNEEKRKNGAEAPLKGQDQTI